MDIQIRYDSGALRNTDSMKEALNELVSPIHNVEKISWTVGSGVDRFIVRSDGSWEYRQTKK